MTAASAPVPAPRNIPSKGVLAPALTHSVQDLLTLCDRLRSRGATAEEIADEVMTVAVSEQVDYSHPGYLGLYNSAPLPHTLAFARAETTLNAQVAAVSESPLLHGLEQEFIRQMCRTVWDDAPHAGGILTSGGATSNLLAIVCGLGRNAPEAWAESGVQALGTTRVYASDLAHATITRNSRIIGIGDRSVHRFPVSVPGQQVRERLAEDSAAGISSVMFVGTLGDSVFGEFDLRPDVLDAVTSTGTYLHADAAWAGALTVLPEYRHLVASMSAADSITIDLHKWPATPFGTSMLLLKDARALAQCCRIWSDYAPVDDADFADRGIEWSRCSRALSAYASLILYRDEFQAVVDRHFELAARLRRSLRSIGWDVVNRSPFPVVCFTRPGLTTADAESVAEQLLAADIYVTTCVYRETACLRAAMINAHTAEEVLDDLVARLRWRFPHR
ncbi:pyridoxal-dependent decarboxylase [Streptomyces sp. NBC_01231]|nr:pyridoxal-dependent decarboxylase [Streptomyces sp. NBC_01231]